MTSGELFHFAVSVPRSSGVEFLQLDGSLPLSIGNLFDSTRPRSWWITPCRRIRASSSRTHRPLTPPPPLSA